MCYVSNKIKYLHSTATSIFRLDTNTLEVEQIYFTDFEVLNMQIREIKNQVKELTEAEIKLMMQKSSPSSSVNNL